MPRPRTNLRVSTGSPGLVLPVDAVTETFGVLGVRGSGKTTTAKVVVEELTAAGQQVVVIDPLGVWWGLKSSADGSAAGLPFVVLGGDHGDLPITPQSGELIADLVVRDPVPVVADLSLMRKGEQRQWMTAFAETLYHQRRTALHLVVDEVDLFAPQRPVKGAERLLGAMEDLVRRGRARGIGVTAITQRPASVHKDILSQVSTLVVHRLVGPQDRKAIDAWVEANGTKEQRDQLMGSIASLDTGQAWFWSPSWLDVFTKVTVRAPHTFDSSATPKPGERRTLPSVFATVDLAALQAQMEAVVEEAEHNNPKVLQRLLTETKRDRVRLEQELAALRQKMTSGPQVVTREVAVIPGPVTDAIRTTAEGLEAAAAALRDAADAHSRVLCDTASGFVDHASRLRAVIESVDLTAEAGAAPVGQTRPAGDINPATGTSTPVRRVRDNVGQTDGHLPKGARRMLAALVRSYPRRLSTTQLLTMAGMKRSGTSQSYIKTLMSDGYITYGSDRLFEATRAAFDVIGTDIPDRPMTSPELISMWRATLPQGAQRMFDVLVGCYPTSVDKIDLIERSGMTPSGTSHGYIKTLERNNLVTVTGQDVTAADDLFIFDAAG